MKKYIRCKRCVMDTTACDITFDIEGNCNFCEEFLHKLKDPQALVNRTDELNKFVEQIKREGKNKQYDCIVGLSGGVDSSYTIHQVKKFGLRPLAVHMDNGWNSELSTNNIKNLIEKLSVDLYTSVIDWEEYKGLMQAFFDADIIDIELLYDNAMMAVNYELASKYNIKYVLSGSNTYSEGMKMPDKWNWYKYDKKNINALAKKNNIKIKTLPTIGTLNLLYYRYLKKIKWIPFLDYLNYDKAEATEFLVKEYSFKKYPYKHYESIFTRFYQGYILPNKFNVDKRLLHLSTLICSEQITRDFALDELKKIPYHSEKELQDDIDYFLKKMQWKITDLEDYIRRPEKAHSIYGSEKKLMDVISKLYRLIKK